VPPALVTERLRLRSFEPSDVEAIERYVADPEYLRHLGPGHPSAAQLVANNIDADPEREPGWVICFGDEIVGTIFLSINRADATAELACMLAPAHWGKGFASEAAAAVVDHAFAACAVEKIAARAEVSNVASIRAMERTGFVREGVLRSHRVDRDGRRCDEVVYGLLRSARSPGG
jgi:RimJ/RimL family protein N-acetyltransferase